MSARQRIGCIVDSVAVQRLVTVLIVLNAVSLGLETVPEAVARLGGLLAVFDQVVVFVYAVEIAAKLAHRGWGFFRIGWNVFDFIIVAIALVPAAGPFSVLRVLRIMRTLRLLSVVPAMRTVVQALITAMPGILSVGPILALLFYVCAVLTTNLFGATFPDLFGTIGASLYTLFQVMTLDDWSEGVVRPLMVRHPWAWVFFVAFILTISFTVINLFVGVIVDAVISQHGVAVEPAGALAGDGGVERIMGELARLGARLASVERDLAETRRAFEAAGDAAGE
jgi:voltage-gated sodium channel